MDEVTERQQLPLTAEADTDEFMRANNNQANCNHEERLTTTLDSSEIYEGDDAQNNPTT